MKKNHGHMVKEDRGGQEGSSGSSYLNHDPNDHRSQPWGPVEGRVRKDPGHSAYSVREGA